MKLNLNANFLKFIILSLSIVVSSCLQEKNVPTCELGSAIRKKIDSIEKILLHLKDTNHVKEVNRTSVDYVLKAVDQLNSDFTKGHYSEDIERDILLFYCAKVYVPLSGYSGHELGREYCEDNLYEDFKFSGGGNYFGDQPAAVKSLGIGLFLSYSASKIKLLRESLLVETSIKYDCKQEPKRQSDGTYKSESVCYGQKIILPKPGNIEASELETAINQLGEGIATLYYIKESYGNSSNQITTEGAVNGFFRKNQIKDFQDYADRYLNLIQKIKSNGIATYLAVSCPADHAFAKLNIFKTKKELKVFEGKRKSELLEASQLNTNKRDRAI